MEASVGSELKLDRAYLDNAAGQAICCWIASNKDAVEALFKKAGVKTESIREVNICCA